MEGLIILFAIGFGFCIGQNLAYCYADKKWQSELIKSGLARHNPYTGKWEWTSHLRKPFSGGEEKTTPPTPEIHAGG